MVNVYKLQNFLKNIFLLKLKKQSNENIKTTRIFDLVFVKHSSVSGSIEVVAILSEF